ncbi:MAG: type IX secretion system membrane protein PorP/SprF [Flavobacteriales bacterium]
MIHPKKTYRLASGFGIIPCLIALLFFSSRSLAQQEWSYSQYLFNLYDINSAYAGNHNASSFGLRYRSQWIGSEGAPVTQQISWHAPVAKGKIGLGIRFNNESIGLRNQQLALISAAYKLQLNKSTLSFGVAGGGIRQTFKSDDALARNPEDVVLQNRNNAMVPVINFALFFNSDRFYAGAESSRINKKKFYSEEDLLSRLYYNINVTAGYMIKRENDNMLQFGGLLKLSEGNIWQAELNVLYLKNNKFWFGGGYRYQHGVIVTACLNITPQWRFGLSYDLPFMATTLQQSGSAEAFLGFNLKGTSAKSIRYF